MNRITTLESELGREVDLRPLDPDAGADQDSGNDLAVTLRLIWSAVYRNWILIVGIVLACVLAGIVVTMLTTPMYRAVATVQIEQQDAKVLSSDDTSPLPAMQDTERFLQTQQDVLMSRTLAERVANSLNLSKDDNFLRAMGVEPATDLTGVEIAAWRRQQVIDTVQRNVNVGIPKNSRIAQISFRSPNPVIAAQLANSYAQNYITWNMKRKFDTSAYARDFLNDQLSVAKQKLEDSERAAIAYSRQAGLIDTSLGTGANDGTLGGPRSLTTSNLVQINSAYTAAEAARVAAQQRWLQASQTPLLSLPEVLSNGTIMALTQRRAELQAAYQQELQRRQPEFPTMRQAAAQIAELDQQIRALAVSVRNTIRDAYVTAAKQERALAGNVQALKSVTLSEQDRSVKFNILKRETDTNRQMYDGLLQRYKEVSAAAGVSANNISIIDSAEVPTVPYSPRSTLNLALSLLIGFTIASLVVLLREKFDDVVRSPDEVQQKLGLRVLNSIPLMRDMASPEEALDDPRSSLSEAYAALRASIDLSTATGAPRSLIVTSSRQSEGKSTSAFALARDFAKIGRRVLLIDGDLRKPSLHRVLGLTNGAGLTNVLTRHRDFADTVQETRIPNLSFLSSGPLPPNPAELLSGALFPKLIEDVSQDYDMVIVDGPPVLGLADTILISSVVDACVFVIEANGSHRGHAKAAIRRLTSSGAKIIGVVLTKFDARKIGYGYGYGSGYSYYYSYGQDSPRKLK